jgi:putative IMPACT (imprinted ancient) family translation regulator
LVVVSRTFGGTKLGKGGLARAYRDAAGAAVAGAGTSETVVSIAAIVSVAVSRDGAVRNLVARHGGAVAGAAYTDAEARLSIVVPAESLDALREAVEALARGRARITIEPAGPPPGGPAPVPPGSGRRRR